MQPGQKVAFYTLGCKLNFAETSTIARSFVDQGYARVDFDERPDVYVINTCSVTDNADKKCRAVVRQALKVNPEAFVAIIGCYAQLKPQEIAQIPGVDMVLGANEKFNIPDYVADQKKEKGEVVAGEIKYVKEFIPSYSISDRTRSFLKIQDGCDYFCAFCTIPLARGRSRSNSIESTLQVAHEVAKTEVNEVVLTGVNIGDFGKGSDETFYDLVQELDKVEGIARYRISSIEPNLLSDKIIRFVAQSNKFAPHFHIPLQSGSDEILLAMRRRYDRQLYANRVQLIKELMPDCCIGVDVIVGFPGETKEKFMETYEFLNELDVSYLHVFTYSERANTTAVRMGDPVPAAERQERSKMLRILSQKKRRHFYSQHLGTQCTVLFESKTEDGLLQGFTENYVRVAVPYDAQLINQMRQVQLDTTGPEGIILSQLCETIPA